MPMPYTLTRGPILTLLENGLNPRDTDARKELRDALGLLRTGVPLVDIGWVTSQSVAKLAVPLDPLDVRLDRDWLGHGDPPGKKTTGYWVGYQGDVESVLREGVVRTIEVALGLAHDADPATATRAWPIEVQWKCPNPYFEVWVSWREHGPGTGDGHVTMLICTPPDKVNRLVTHPRLPPSYPGITEEPTPLADPVSATDPQGMWLVAHEHHVPNTGDQVVDVHQAGDTEPLVNLNHQTSLHRNPEGTWFIPMPTTLWVDEGPVVVVSPPSYAGGNALNHSNLTDPTPSP